VVRVNRPEAIELIAMVLAWQVGESGSALRQARLDAEWQEAADECIDDLIQAGAWEPEP
jgi:hypothetical protein